MAFLEQLGITRKRIVLDGIELALPTEFEKKILTADGKEGIRVDRSLLRYLEREQGSRAEQRAQLESLLEQNKELASEEAFSRWQEDVCELPALLPTEGSILFVVTRAANPDHAQLRIALEARLGIRTKQDKYGYPRAFTKAPCATVPTGLRVLDPTSGGGSIGFEAMRLGHEVIANELNPVATLTLHAGLDFPVRYGRELSGEIAMWGGILGERLRERMQDLFPQTNADEELDGFLFLRQGRCPSCAGELVLLNSLWLSRKKDNAWAVKLETDGKPRNGCVTFNCHRVQAPASFVDTGTVKRAIGRCLHCDQKVESAER